MPFGDANTAARLPSTGTAPEPLSYTLQDAARVTGLSVATLRRKEKEGQLRFYKVGFRTLVAAGSLREMLTRQAA